MASPFGGIVGAAVSIFGKPRRVRFVPNAWLHARGTCRSCSVRHAGKGSSYLINTRTIRTPMSRPSSSNNRMHTLPRIAFRTAPPRRRQATVAFQAAPGRRLADRRSSDPTSSGPAPRSRGLYPSSTFSNLLPRVAARTFYWPNDRLSPFHGGAFGVRSFQVIVYSSPHLPSLTMIVLLNLTDRWRIRFHSC